MVLVNSETKLQKKDFLFHSTFPKESEIYYIPLFDLQFGYYTRQMHIFIALSS